MVWACPKTSARAIQYELLGDRHRPRPVRSPRRGEGVRRLAVRSLRHPLRQCRRQRRDGRAGTAVPALQPTARTGAATGTGHPLPSPVAPRWLTRTRRTSTSPSGSWHSSPVARNGCSPSSGDYPTGAAAAASPPSRCGRAPSRASRYGPSSPRIITAVATEDPHSRLISTHYWHSCSLRPYGGDTDGPSNGSTSSP